MKPFAPAVLASYMLFAMPLTIVTTSCESARTSRKPTRSAVAKSLTTEAMDALFTKATAKQTPLTGEKIGVIVVRREADMVDVTGTKPFGFDDAGVILGGIEHLLGSENPFDKGKTAANAASQLGEREQYTARLKTGITADIEGAITTRVLDMFIDKDILAFTPENLRANLEAAGISDPAALHDPAVAQKFQQHLSSDPEGCPIDGLLIVTHISEQVEPGSVSLAYSVRATYSKLKGANLVLTGESTTPEYLDFETTDFEKVIVSTDVAEGPAQGGSSGNKKVDPGAVGSSPKPKNSPAAGPISDRDGNDTLADASQATVGSSFAGMVGKAGDEFDFVRFIAPKDGTIAVQVVNTLPKKTPGKIAFEVVDGSGNKLKAAAAHNVSAAEEQVRDVSLSGGAIYYVKVWTQSPKVEQPVPYKLSLTQTTTF
jgi:hypothetical protein